MGKPLGAAAPPLATSHIARNGSNHSRSEESSSEKLSQSNQVFEIITPVQPVEADSPKNTSLSSSKGSSNVAGGTSTTTSSETCGKKGSNEEVQKIKAGQIREKREKFLRDLVQRLRNPALNLPAKLEASEMKRVALYCREKFMLEPALLEIEAPVTVVGDVHGQFTDLLGIFDQNGDPPKTRYLFLGDYVDRGPFQSETILLLMVYKLLYPKTMHLLRGNHETRVINRVYGFLDELKTRFGDAEPGLWELYQSTFSCMSLCARISKRILCMHGGIPKELSNWKQLQVIRKPLEVPDHGVVCDLLWADPDPDTQGFQTSPRGVSYLFGEIEVKEFCQTMGLDLVIRAHQVAQDGYEFFANRHLVTIFSAPFYCEEFDNTASVVAVSADLECRFRLRQPVGIERKFLEMTLKDATKDEPLPCELDPPKSRFPVPPGLSYVLGEDAEVLKHQKDELQVSVRDLNQRHDSKR